MLFKRPARAPSNAPGKVVTIGRKLSGSQAGSGIDRLSLSTRTPRPIALSGPSGRGLERFEGANDDLMGPSELECGPHPVEKLSELDREVEVRADRTGRADGRGSPTG